MKEGENRIMSSISTKMSLDSGTTKNSMKMPLFSIDKYYLDYNMKVLTILGMWNPYKDDKKHWLYNFYSFMVLFMVLIMRMLGEINNMWMMKDDLVTIVRPLTDCISFALILSKCLNLIVQRSEITKIMDMFNWERRILCSRKISQHRNGILTSTVKYSELFTNIVIGTAVTYCIVLFGTLIDMKNATIDDLPISATPFKLILEPFNVWVALFIDYATYSFYIGMFFLHDVLFLNLMMNIASQLEILNFRLVNCFRMNSEDASIKIRGRSGGITFECFEFNSDESFTPNEELIICIQHYNEIYRMVKILKKVLRLILLPQLMISLLWLSILGFYLFVATSNEEQDLGATIYNAIDFGTAVVQILIFCWTGHSIIINSDRVSSAAYEGHWYEGDKEFKMNLMILRSLVINPMVISAVGVFELSAVTFKNMLIKSYSAIALLRQMYE